MEGAARNSSFSQIRLTKNNYSQQPLLSTFRGNSNLTVLALSDMSRDDEDDSRPPESSEDEAGAPAKGTGLPSSSTTSPRAKRKPEPAKGTRASKRTRLTDQPGLSSSTIVKEPAKPSGASQDWAHFEFLSQASQPSQRKRQKGYGNQQKHKYTTANSHPSSSKFDPSDVAGTEDQRLRTKAVDLGEDIGDRVDGEPARATAAHDFSKTDDNLEPKSSVSTTSSKLFTSDQTPEPEAPVKNKTTLSSPPTSPEIFDIEEITLDPPEPETEPTSVKCPVCRKEVDRTLLPSTMKNPRLLSTKKQKDFCHQHRLSEVDVMVKEQKYPTIDWEVLELQRIPNHMDHLRRVLKGKTRSYYLDQLKDAVSKAKGNRKVIRSYITEGVLDVVKAGYYGPKGTSIMLDQVSSKLSNDLNKMLKDKLVQPIGLGGYAAAVLVPELRLQLVMEDLDIKDEAEGRRVLDKSTEIGLLLYPDEDQIEPDELM